MPVEEVWSKGSSVFKEWVKNYTRHRNFQSRKHYSKRSGFKGRELHFKSRFHPEDFRSIEKTLKVLRSYDKSLVLFVSRIIERYPERDDIVDRIACALYLLTYDTHRSPRDVLRLLREENFEAYFKRWNETRWYRKKRLWAAFRDYVKVGSDYRECFLEALRRRSSEKTVDLFSRFGREMSFLNQLELPGDIWNNNEIFVNNFLKRLAKRLGVRMTNKDIRAGMLNLRVREICNKARTKGYDVYPEQFDVTFAFVPRMCANDQNRDGTLCRTLCPFGTGDRVFLSYHPGSQFCLSSYLLLGEFTNCNKEEHDLFLRNTGRRSCFGFTRRHLF